VNLATKIKAAKLAIKAMALFFGFLHRKISCTEKVNCNL
jgi:hypothetical protein